MIPEKGQQALADLVKEDVVRWTQIIKAEPSLRNYGSRLVGPCAEELI
jgi:hypothetical protein